MNQDSKLMIVASVTGCVLFVSLMTTVVAIKYMNYKAEIVKIQNCR